MTGVRVSALVLGLVVSGSLVAGIDEPTTDHSTALDTDSSGRYTAMVKLDAHGPVPFIVDTGSQTSALTQLAAGRLQLRSGLSVPMIGANGTQSTKIVTIHDYRSDVFQRQFESMMIIPNAAVTTADGIMGMNAFTNGRLEFDFAHRLLTFGPSRPVPKGFSGEPGDVHRNNFLIVDVVVDGVRAKAMIDTGGTYTAGNPQLQAALGIASNDPRMIPLESMRGVTTQQTTTTMTRLRGVTLGPVTFTRPAIMFADLPIFHTLDLDGGPAMIIGVDLLSHFQAIAIDYPRAELQLQP